MEGLDQRSYFFDAGIRFSCRRCGDCCTGAPGVVRLTPTEVDGIATFLGISAVELIDIHLVPWEGGYRIDEWPDGRCRFFENGCLIYAVRPRQCRTFPFWFSNMRNDARWQAVCRTCPGIGQGRLFTKTEIMDLLNGDD